jgi:hypothetical protein
MTLLRTLDLDYDVVEIHYNPLLSNKPYLVRVFSYNSTDPVELRLDEDEIKNLYTVLKQHNLL